MEENAKKEAQNINDYGYNESAYPGTPLSSMTQFDVKKVIEDIDKYGKTDHLLTHSGYGHMSMAQLLVLAKARNINPQWSEIRDDAIKFATTICMEEDIQKIQDALHEFIDVEDSHSKFIRKALARSILKTDMRCRVKSTKIVVDEEKLKIEMDDSEDKSLKEYLNDTFGNPYKKIPPNTDLNSKYAMHEEDEE